MLLNLVICNSLWLWVVSLFYIQSTSISWTGWKYRIGLHSLEQSIYLLLFFFNQFILIELLTLSYHSSSFVLGIGVGRSCCCLLIPQVGISCCVPVRYLSKFLPITLPSLPITYRSSPHFLSISWYVSYSYSHTVSITYVFSYFSCIFFKYQWVFRMEERKELKPGILSHIFK